MADLAKYCRAKADVEIKEENRKNLLVIERARFTDYDRGMICSLVNAGCSFEQMTEFWPKQTPSAISLHHWELNRSLMKIGDSAENYGRRWRLYRLGVGFPDIEHLPTLAPFPRISTLQVDDEYVIYKRHTGLQDGVNKHKIEEFIKTACNFDPFQKGINEDESDPLEEFSGDTEINEVKRYLKAVHGDSIDPAYIDIIAEASPLAEFKDDLYKDDDEERSKIRAKLADKEWLTEFIKRVSNQLFHLTAARAHIIAFSRLRVAAMIYDSVPDAETEQKTGDGTEVKAEFDDAVTKADTHKDRYLTADKIDGKLTLTRLTEDTLALLHRERVDCERLGSRHFERQRFRVAEAGSFTEDDFLMSAADMAKRKNRDAAKKHHKKVKKVIIVDDSSSGSSDSSSSGGSVMSFNSDDDILERMDQNNHLYHGVYAAAYPPNVTLKADEHWSEDDCKTLAVIESKYEALKWQHMQAEFYNATGRMVFVDLIKAKFEEVKKD